MMRRLVLSMLAVGILLATTKPPATVAEQRARLPPPAECDDPVVGTWRAHKFTEPLWEEFTLHVNRVSGDPSKLEGTIYNHYWYGDATREQAGKCDSIQFYRVRIKMPARGSADGLNIVFRGTSYTVDHQFCGEPHGYNVDEFTGTIDVDKQEFQSVNNDGGQMRDHPTLFRRTACSKDAGALDDNAGAPPPSIKVRPPPILPETSSCNCGLF